jgi:hypothetical protein
VGEFVLELLKLGDHHLDQVAGPADQTGVAAAEQPQQSCGTGPGEGEVSSSFTCPAQVPADAVLVGIAPALAGQFFQGGCLAVLGEPFQYQVPEAADLILAIGRIRTKLQRLVLGVGETSQKAVQEPSIRSPRPPERSVL